MTRKRISSLLLVLALCCAALLGCATNTPSATPARQRARNASTAEATQDPSATSADPAAAPSQARAAGSVAGIFATVPYDGSQIAAYTGEPYVAVHDNVPFFTPKMLVDTSYETYGDLDSLGRCTEALASIGTDLMPTEKRSSIQEVKPSGWNQAFYDIVESEALYNRCHLIGYQLTGENANEQNLITGTRYMNTEGMLPFENLVADYIAETDNHVLYRVTPIFSGDELVARGVLMEAQSVEDDGEGVQFCEFIYNVQPGIGIDYSNGESWLDDNTAQPAPIEAQEAPEQPAAAQAIQQPAADGAQATGETAACGSYVLNTKSLKFHTPACSAVGQMNPDNAESFTGTREELIAMGYESCGACNP